MSFNLVLSVWRWLDRWQSKLSSRIISSVILLVAVLVGGIPTLNAVFEFSDSRSDLRDAISGEEAEVLGLALQTTGRVIVDGRTYEDLRLIDAPILNENGLIGDPEELVRILLTPKIPRWVPVWLIADPSLAVFMVMALLVWSVSVVWLGLLFPFIFVGISTTLLSVLASMFLGNEVVISIASIGAIGFTYIVLVRFILWIFSGRTQVLTIGSNLIREANRTKLSLFFIIALLVLLPLLPLTLDPETPLRYQLQTFISRGVALTFTLTALMTLLLACSTVAFEIRDRQVWHLFTKPVSYWSYVLGKWLGILALNGVIFFVGSLSILLYVQYLRTQPVASGEAGFYDRLAIDQEVLVARKSASPFYQLLNREQLTVRVQEMIDKDPELSRKERIPLQTRYKFENELQESFLTTQRSVPPSIGENLGARTIVFNGLNEAKSINRPLSLRYLFYIRSADEHEKHRVGLMFNQDPKTMRTVTYVPTVASVQMISPNYIQDDGSLLITLVNLYDQDTHKSSITWDPDGVQLLYTVGGFEGNFLRASLLLWLEISAIGAIALSAATAFGFPVALLASFTLFAASQTIPFLIDSLRYVNPKPFDWSNFGQVFESLFDRFSSIIGELTVFVLSAFGKFQPANALVEGLLVSWKEVGGAFISFGILWSGLVLLLGYIALSRRQLAIYSGNG